MYSNLETLKTVERLITRPDVWYLVAAATLNALADYEAIPLIYRHAVSTLPPGPARRSPSPAFSVDDLPRRKVVRRLKEALLKQACLVGVSKSIEASLRLSDALEEGDKDDSLSRPTASLDIKQLEERGRRGLERVYKGNLGPIFERFGADNAALREMSVFSTYGYFLAYVREDDPDAPLTFAETEAIILTSLICAKSKREVSWHLRGCLRSGFSHDEVEGIQQAVELLANERGIDVKTDMPRVNDVTETDDLS